MPTPGFEKRMRRTFGGEQNKIGNAFGMCGGEQTSELLPPQIPNDISDLDLIHLASVDHGGTFVSDDIYPNSRQSIGTLKTFCI